MQDRRRVLRLSGGPKPRSGVTVQFLPGGPRVTTVSGSAAAVVTGNVVANDGSRLGELAALLNEALTAYEELLARWGLPPS